MTDSTAGPAGVAAVRGAVPVRANRSEDIVEATARLLTTLLEVNRLDRSRIVSAIFTSTEDLDADFPAHAARRLGWTDVPLLNAREIPVPGAMPRVVRVLLTVWGVAPGTRLVPVYLDTAAALRPDLAPGAPGAEREATPAHGSGGPASGGAAARRVAIVGLGQIGGSIALALGRAGGWWRAGFDADPATARAARAAGAIDEIAAGVADACAGADLAVIATPVDSLPDLIDAAAAALPGGAALLDTGGVRGPLVAALERAARRGVAAVGGHPLAGTEGHGFAAARADLFEGAPFTLSPAAGDVPPVVTRLVRDLGARAAVVAPDHHDRALARTSHLPYLVACALLNLGRRARDEGLSGPGFRDMTRLAASDPRVAGATCRANASAVSEAWRALRESMDRSIAAIADEPS
jgi:monofunctional chorismate mutase